MLAAGVAGVVALAFIVEGALGFGATLVALSLGAFLVPVPVLLPALLPLNLALSATLVVREHAHIDRSLLLLRVVPLMALGAPLGFFGLAHLDVAIATRAFGGVVLALALLALFRRAPLPTALGAPLLIAAGAVHGAFGTGGPLVVAALARQDKRTLRATLSALWLLLNLALLAAFIVDGRFGAQTLELAAPGAVGAVVGGILGMRLHDALDAGRFTRLVWAALAGAGLLLIVR